MRVTPRTALLVVFWGVWGAFSSAPTDLYGYPEEMIYVLWSLTMLVPNYFALRGHRMDRRPIATIYGLVIGFTTAGGQLLLFKALDIGPAYLIFPLISISPAVTVLMAIGLLRERIHMLASIGVVLALMALSRGKAAIVSPVTNALAPVVTIVLSLAAYQTLPSIYGGIGIVLALAGSTLIVYGDETTSEGDQTAEEQREALENEHAMEAPRRH